MCSPGNLHCPAGPSASLSPRPCASRTRRRGHPRNRCVACAADCPWCVNRSRLCDGSSTGRATSPIDSYSRWHLRRRVRWTSPDGRDAIVDAIGALHVVERQNAVRRIIAPPVHKVDRHAAAGCALMLQQGVRPSTAGSATSSGTPQCHPILAKATFTLVEEAEQADKPSDTIQAEPDSKRDWL